MSAKTKPTPYGPVRPLAGGRQVEWVREASGEHKGNEHFRKIGRAHV